MRRVVLFGLIAIGAAACERGPGFIRSQTPHEAYTESLRRANLLDTALGRAWTAAADSALREAKPAALPLEGSVTFAAARPGAVGYRLALKRGRVLHVAVEMGGSDPALVFLDLFRLREGEPPDHVDSADAGALAIEREIERDGEYILRIQPELLREGTITVTQRTSASLAFPVAGRGSAAVQSFFRDPRDGGSREHHGVDIFAPRNTPVLAASGGVVSSVATTPRGGNVVWVWDAGRGQSHYYAHLAGQAVRVGAVVRAGDVIGYVGNTGNARTTAPHLHFGIYARGDGPIDPLPFVQGATAPPVAAPVN